jgi:hypothetical protein
MSKVLNLLPQRRYFMKGMLLLPSSIIIYLPFRHSNIPSFNRSDGEKD